MDSCGFNSRKKEACASSQYACIIRVHRFTNSPYDLKTPKRNCMTDTGHWKNVRRSISHHTNMMTAVRPAPCSKRSAHVRKMIRNSVALHPHRAGIQACGNLYKTTHHALLIPQLQGAKLASNMHVMGEFQCVTRRKQHRPGIASNDNTMHATTARSSADLTKPNQTPTRHNLAKDTIILHIATPQAASTTRTRRTYTGMRPHAPGQQAGDHSVPAHPERH